MQKFPLRMKDNDLLVTELYHDPSNDAITALSVYLTPKTSEWPESEHVSPFKHLPFLTNTWYFSVGVSGNWIEIAYGTSSGAVRVIVQHPETVGSGPQLFQTFTVHRSPVTKIMLSEKHLVSGNTALLTNPKSFSFLLRFAWEEKRSCGFVLQCVQTITTWGRGRWLALEAWSRLSLDPRRWLPLRSSRWRRRRATAATPQATTSVSKILLKALWLQLQ